MNKKVTFLFLFLINSLIGLSQNIRPTIQSNNSLDFTDFISGVKYAYLAMSEEDVRSIAENPTGGNAQAIVGILDYLNAIGFTDAKWGTFEKAPQNHSSLCDLVIVHPSWGFKNSSYTNIKLTFISCNQDIFEFKLEKNIWVTGYTNIRNAFYSNLIKVYSLKKKYDPFQRLEISSEMTDWNEQKLKSHFQENGAGFLEGIYESVVGTPSIPKYKLGVVKSKDEYTLIYLSGATNHEDWTEGEVKAKLTSTATPRLFKAHWKMGNKKENDNAYITFDNGLMSLVMQDKEKTVFIKLFPKFNDQVSVSSSTSSSGTGFGITTNGLIVTNYHVVENSSKISVRGINGDFSKSYSAKIITEDKKNDLAILQITDPSFSSLGLVPFTIASKSSDVGSSVFALGYPLKALMGDEIKLTNGIISSKSGYKGDVTSYQISVPLQPGNSGGPLFDENGNLIGIVNAKLTIGENVSYAIKASYLTNLLDLLPTTPNLQTINSLTKRNFIEKVKHLNKFVFIIEVN